jgi:hypothetical protein
MVRCRGAVTAAARNAIGTPTILGNHKARTAKKEGNMRARKLLIVILTFALGALFGWQLAIYSQTSGDSLRKLAEERKDLTKMEWVLVNARLNALESPVSRYSGSPITSAGFEFDSVKGRIVASAFIQNGSQGRIWTRRRSRSPQAQLTSVVQVRGLHC